MAGALERNGASYANATITERQSGRKLTLTGSSRWKGPPQPRPKPLSSRSHLLATRLSVLRHERRDGEGEPLVMNPLGNGRG